MALVSFGAGAMCGYALHTTAAACSGAATPEADYAHELAMRYGLSSRQERSLRLVLQNDREQEIAILKSAEPNQLPPTLVSKLLAARNRTEQLIRAVLDDEQRSKYDADSRPGAPPGGDPTSKR